MPARNNVTFHQSAKYDPKKFGKTKQTRRTMQLRISLKTSDFIVLPLKTLWRETWLRLRPVIELGWRGCGRLLYQPDTHQGGVKIILLMMRSIRILRQLFSLKPVLSRFLSTRNAYILFHCLSLTLGLVWSADFRCMKRHAPIYHLPPFPLNTL